MEQQASIIDQTGGDHDLEDTALAVVANEHANTATELFEDARGQPQPSPTTTIPSWSLADSWEVDLFLPELQCRRRHRRRQLELIENEDDQNVMVMDQNDTTATTAKNTVINVLDVPVIPWSAHLSAFSVDHLLQATLGTLVRHPGQLMATLVRLGYEPLPGKPTTSLLTGRPMLQLPGLFAYLGHIARTDGFSGLFRGLHYNVLYAVLYRFVYENVHAALEEEKDEIESQEGGEAANDHLAIFRSRPQLQRALLREVSARLAAGLIAAPLHVATVRCMAQLVGGETVYSSLGGALAEMVRSGGLLGLFAGAVPAVLAELLSVAIRWSVYYGLEQVQQQQQQENPSSSSCSAVRRQLAIRGSGARVALLAATNHLASSAASPLRTVATVMAVSGAAGSLAAARLPPNQATTYRNWLLCLAALAAAGEASRGGGSLFWRSRPLPAPQPLLSRLLTLLRFQ